MPLEQLLALYGYGPTPPTDTQPRPAAQQPRKQQQSDSGSSMRSRRRNKVVPLEPQKEIPLDSSDATRHEGKKKALASDPALPPPPPSSRDTSVGVATPSPGTRTTPTAPSDDPSQTRIGTRTDAPGMQIRSMPITPLPPGPSSSPRTPAMGKKAEGGGGGGGGGSGGAWWKGAEHEDTEGEEVDVVEVGGEEELILMAGEKDAIKLHQLELDHVVRMDDIEAGLRSEGTDLSMGMMEGVGLDEEHHVSEGEGLGGDGGGGGEEGVSRLNELERRLEEGGSGAVYEDVLLSSSNNRLHSEAGKPGEALQESRVNKDHLYLETT